MERLPGAAKGVTLKVPAPGYLFLIHIKNTRNMVNMRKTIYNCYPANI